MEKDPCMVYWYLFGNCYLAHVGLYLLTHAMGNRRIASQVIYSGLISVLGDNWPKSINNLFQNTNLQGQDEGGRIRPRLETGAVVLIAVLFSVATVFSSYSQYLLDK